MTQEKSLVLKAQVGLAQMRPIHSFNPQCGWFLTVHDNIAYKQSIVRFAIGFLLSFYWIGTVLKILCQKPRVQFSSDINSNMTFKGNLDVRASIVLKDCTVNLSQYPSVQGIKFCVQCNTQYKIQYSVLYSVQYNVHIAERLVFLREVASSASHLDVWYFIQ